MRGRSFCIAVLLLPCFLFSCTRRGVSDGGDLQPGMQSSAQPLVQPLARPSMQPLALPLAVLQAGEFPLWFQFTAEGPVLIETVEDAIFSAALIPWPLAPHIRFILAQKEELLMAVNRDGFICFSPWREKQGGDIAAGTGLYRIPGGDLWQQYTAGAFILLNEKPAALLYRDDRFLDSDAPPPSPRLWTFDLHSSGPKPLPMPSLDVFSPEDGWDVDTLRRGGDGHWYFRTVRKNVTRPEILMFRSSKLTEAGEQVSLGAFRNAALPEPLAAAPSPLRELLAAAFAGIGSETATVVSPEFQSARSFTKSHENTAATTGITGFYSGRPEEGFFLAILPNGAGLYTETGTAPSVRPVSLPPLPEGFVYTGIGVCTDTVFASWEEQEGYSIGAAGFMAIRLSAVLK